MVENKCSNCVWWRSDHQSVCTLIELSDGDSDDGAVSIHVSVCDDTGLDVQLATSKDFGCNEFTPDGRTEKPLRGDTVKDQHTKITGYRDLTQAEIDEINQCKKLGEACGELINTLRATPNIDAEALNIGKIKLKEGIMWLVRSIAKPGGF